MMRWPMTTKGVLILALTGGLLPLPGSAATLVFDAANTAEAALAVKRIKDQIDELQQYRAQFMEYKQTFDGYRAEFESYRDLVKDFQQWRGKFDRKTLKSLGDAALAQLAKDMGVETQILRSIQASSREAHGNLSRLNRMYEQFELSASFAKMTTPQFWQFERERLQLHRQADRSYYNNLAQTVQQVQMDIAKLNQLRQAIPEKSDDAGATSLRAVMEVSASHLNVIANQNAQLYTMLSEGFLLQQASATNDKGAVEAAGAESRRARSSDWARANAMVQASCARMRTAHKAFDYACVERSPPREQP
jgi:hypothetical protein